MFFFFAVQTVCMGTRCWTVGSRSAPPTPRRGCWTTAVRPVGTTSCPPRPPAPTVLLCQVRKIHSWHHGIHVITSLFGLVHWLHCFRTCEHSQKVHCVGKMVLWIVFVVSVGDTCCGRWWRWPVAYRHYHCCLLLLSQKSKRKGWIKISTWCGKDIMIFSYFL